jgi:hypothetical protein
LQVIAPGLHLTILGLLLLAVILFMRDGIVPVLARQLARRRTSAPARPLAAGQAEA